MHAMYISVAEDVSMPFGPCKGIVELPILTMQSENVVDCAFGAPSKDCYLLGCQILLKPPFYHPFMHLSAGV